MGIDKGVLRKETDGEVVVIITRGALLHSSCLGAGLWGFEVSKRPVDPGMAGLAI